MSKVRKISKRHWLFAGVVAAALAVEPLRMDDLVALAQRHCGAQDARSWLAVRLAEAEASGIAARYPDGRWGPVG